MGFARKSALPLRLERGLDQVRRRRETRDEPSANRSRRPQGLVAIFNPASSELLPPNFEEKHLPFASERTQTEAKMSPAAFEGFKALFQKGYPTFCAEAKDAVTYIEFPPSHTTKASTN